MIRSLTIFCPVILFATCLAIPTLATDDRSTNRPNIIYILADDLGYAELGCYGQQKIRTPCLDRLAAEGIRFTQHYSGSAVCAPSRCVLMTGKHTGHAYIRNNSEVKPEGQRPIPAEVVTVAERLQALGYATGATGKWGLGPSGSAGDPNRQGFELFFGYICQRQAHNFYPRYLWRNNTKVVLEGNDRGLTGPHYSHDLITEAALEFIREHRQGPFFLYVPFTIPHLAIQVPEDSVAEYRGQWDDPPYEGGKGYLPHPAPRAGYAAMVTRMDRSIGQILEEVKTLGLDDETLVMFSSDNGPTYDRLGGSDSDFFTSSGPLKGRKGSLWEGGIRVPLIARWPTQIAPHRTSDHISAFWDMFPTWIELAGGDSPAASDGISIVPTLLNRGEQRQHECLYWEFPGYGGQQAVRMGDWKGIRRQMHQGNRQLELYNLRQDPGETDNIAADHPAITARILARMRAAHTPSPQFPFRAIDGPGD